MAMMEKRERNKRHPNGGQQNRQRSSREKRRYRVWVSFSEIPQKLRKVGVPSDAGLGEDLEEHLIQGTYV